LSWLLAALLLLGSTIPITAQTESRVKISGVDASQFPAISFYLDATDTSGNPLTALTASQLQILENDKTLTPTALERIEPGLQVIVSLNTGPTLTYLAGEATRFEAIRTALLGWINSRPAETSTDDFSLATNTGLQTIRSTNPADWITAVTNYQPDLLNTTPSLVSLTQALDLAVDPNPNPQMKRAILYITPVLPTVAVTALPGLAQRAQQQKVPIYVWLVASPNTPTNSPDLVNNLMELASRSGGQFVLFSEGTPPNPEDYFRPLRTIFQVRYNSQINSSGNHMLAVGLDLPDGLIESNAETLGLIVLPPNPLVLNPPAQIDRVWEQPEDAEAYLTPNSAIISYLIEFPDAHPRPLRTARLYVDGELAIEQSEEPFESFNWDISDYVVTGLHTIQLEVEDSLGLVQRSGEVSITVNVAELKQNFLSRIEVPSATILLIVAALAAGLTLLLALLFTRRKHGVSPSRRERMDPLTQPLPAGKERSARTRRSAGEQVLTRPPQPATPPPTWNARLLPRTEAGETAPADVILLEQNDISIGSDQQQAMVVITSPSVSPLHARITQSEPGVYILADAGSIAGTWINFAPVSSNGARLEHGDLVHFGKAAYRFELAAPRELPHPISTPYHQEE
jgi:hypothetical protein